MLMGEEITWLELERTRFDFSMIKMIKEGVANAFHSLFLKGKG